METTSRQVAGVESERVGDLYSDGCQCREILDLVASRWSALIVGKLQEEPHRFGQLRRAIPGITQKMLTQTLRRLERDGLVDRTVLTNKRPPQVKYSLTSLGLTVTEPLEAMRNWSEQHLPDVRAARQRFERQDTL